MKRCIVIIITTIHKGEKGIPNEYTMSPSFQMRMANNLLDQPLHAMGKLCTIISQATFLLYPFHFQPNPFLFSDKINHVLRSINLHSHATLAEHRKALPGRGQRLRPHSKGQSISFSIFLWLDIWIQPQWHHYCWKCSL